jgi:4,5-DOPA dioxygenase extradiol
MKRNDFLKTIALAPFAGIAMNLNELEKISSEFDSTPKMPVLFVGHGSPMNAIEDNPFTRALKKVGAQYKPSAIMVISAHWLTNGTYVSTVKKPETIYDFGGFPDKLFQQKYPANGSPETAKMVSSMVNHIKEDHEWGLDHGAWSILLHLFPKADIPVFQMSIDYTKPMSYHFELGKQLQQLRNKGVLIISSGNIVHNLRLSMDALYKNDAKPFDWAVDFDNWSKEKLDKREFESLIAFEKHKAGKLASPTPDHYIPMIYTLGLSEKKDTLKHEYEEVTFGAISMRTFSFSS